MAAPRTNIQGASAPLSDRERHRKISTEKTIHNRSRVINSYAPIAIFGSASASVFISFSARRYSTGMTLRNFGK